MRSLPDPLLQNHALIEQSNIVKDFIKPKNSAFSEIFSQGTSENTIYEPINPHLIQKKEEKTSFGRSLKQYNWVLLEPENRLVTYISQALGLDEITARILVNRGVTSLEQAREFLDPKLKDLLPDPFSLLDMDRGIERLIAAIKKREKITIFADYDVDGATSAALIYKFLEKIGVISHIYVADRLNEGYGPSKIAMQKLCDNGTQLIITVDCGISAYEPLAFAKELGLEVIVVDHHLSPQAKLPEAVAVINPNRFDEVFPDKNMAAVGVAFLFITALRKKLREYGWFSSNKAVVAEQGACEAIDIVGEKSLSAGVGGSADSETAILRTAGGGGAASDASILRIAAADGSEAQLCMDSSSALGDLSSLTCSELGALGLAKACDADFIPIPCEEPNLFEFLDLVALGTICDVVPLTLLNRTMVQHGLRYLARNSNLGLSILMEQARIESKLSAYHLGYVLGPRINAGGRIEESSLGTQLLITKDILHAREIVKRLEQLNNERKTIEQQAVEEAIEQIEKQQLSSSSPVLIVHSERWHIGILGILASRLKEKYRKPSLVIAIKDGVGKGSGRSIIGFNIGQILAQAKDSGLLIDGGGHAMAGGFTIDPVKIIDFITYVERTFSSHKLAEDMLYQARQLEIDAVVRAGAINAQLLHFLEQLGPFGQGNPQPRFVMKRVRLVKTIVTHKNHLIIFAEDAEKMQIKRLNADKSPDDARFAHNNVVKCILFRALESDLGRLIIDNSHKTFHIAGLIQPSNIEFGKVDFIIDDIALEE